MLDIWNNAYNIYTDGGYTLMWSYLREQISTGNISRADAETMAKDIAETADL